MKITTYSKISLTAFLLLVLSVFYGYASDMTKLDSIGLERVGDKVFILHKVIPKETLFGISRRYEVSIGEIQEANEVLSQGLKIGQTIRVPYMEKSALPEGFSLHKVNSGETLFSISQKYGVTVDSLKGWNNLIGNDLSVGQSLVLKDVAMARQRASTHPDTPLVSPKPLSPASKVTVAGESGSEIQVASSKSDEAKSKPESVKPEVSSYTPEATTSAPIVPGEWISHMVKPGETLFSISKQYSSSVEDLIQWNGLSSNNLRPGQSLKVGKTPEGPSTVRVIGTPKVASSTAEMKVEPTSKNTSGGFKNISETGQAELIEGTGGHKKYLVLHRTAPIGSIMRVKNEENDITIFARVVGTLPDTGDNAKLLIKLSQAAYDQLRAINQRFPVEILY